jgi:sugar lactone lactonase YvrE
VLWWVDIQAPAIHGYEPDTARRQSWTPPARVTALGLGSDGDLVASGDAGFMRIDPESWTITLLHHPERHLPGNRFNDGKVDPWGRFWAGTMDDAEEEACGSVYRLDLRGGSMRVADGFHVPNGPAFAPDRRSAYLSDTALRRTDRLVLDADGEVRERTPFATFSEDQGYPDGMTVDAQGHVWIAFWDGWCVRRLAPDGVIVEEIRLPVARPTSCVFAGDALDSLFVTSASIGLSEADLARQPLAGGLFRIDPGVRGVAPDRFGQNPAIANLAR